MTRDAAGTYVYGLLERKTKPSLQRVPAGPPDLGPLRALPAGDGLWLLAARAPLARFGAEPIERGLRDLDWVSACALGHERVAEHFLAQGTLLPMKLFTVFTSDEAALAQSQRDSRRIARVTARLRGRDEWGVRVRRREDEDVPAPATARPRSGREFLKRKARVRRLARGPRPGDRARAERAFKALRALAAEALRKEVPDDAGRVLLDAVLLVDRTQAVRLRRAVAAEARTLTREGMDLVLTGPWPAYHFLGARR
jgi:hypothetical protein